MHDRAVTATAANDKKARDEPSDIEKDYRKRILVPLCLFSYTTTTFPRLLNHASFIRSADNALSFIGTENCN